MPVNHTNFGGLPHVTGGATASESERRELVARVAGSDQFRKAPRLRQLLLFITERSLDESTDPAKEQEIGFEVFERPPGYEPQTDNIVRNSVRQLRVKLKEYFEGEGRNESWILDIPKGGYRAVFLPRPISGRWYGLTNAPSTRLSRRVPVILAGFLLLSVVLNVWQRRNTAVEKLAPIPSQHIAGVLFGNPPQPVRIVIGDYGLFLLQSVQGRQFGLHDYVERKFLQFQPSEPFSPRMQAFGQMLATRQVASMGEVNAAFSLARALASGRSTPEVRHSRTLAARDLLRGTQILVGTRNSNPWFHLFEERLRFQDTGHGFVDRAPAGKTSAEYLVADTAASGGRSYARISLIPAGSDSRRTLLIAGVNMSAVEAGAEYVLDRESLTEVCRRLGLAAGDPLPDFEAIVETSAADFTPNRYRLREVVRLGPAAD